MSKYTVRTNDGLMVAKVTKEVVYKIVYNYNHSYIKEHGYTTVVILEDVVVNCSVLGEKVVVYLWKGYRLIEDTY